jgi:hypothetical protein
VVGLAAIGAVLGALVRVGTDSDVEDGLVDGDADDGLRGER